MLFLRSLFSTIRQYWTVGVRVNDIARVSSSSVHHVSHIFRHGNYNQPSNTNDVAMVKLSSPVDLSGRHARPACLPSSASESFDNLVCTVTGWGATYNGQYSLGCVLCLHWSVVWAVSSHTGQ